MSKIVLPHEPPPVAVPALAEFVRNLPPKEQHMVLVTVLREAIRVTGGKCLIPLEDLDGSSLGYYVPPGAEVPQEECYIREVV